MLEVILEKSPLTFFYDAETLYNFMDLCSMGMNPLKFFDVDIQEDEINKFNKQFFSVAYDITKLTEEEQSYIFTTISNMPVKSKSKNIKDNQSIKEVLNLRSILPKNYVIANNKLANQMTKDLMDAVNEYGEKIRVPLVVGKIKNKPITTFNCLSYDNEKLKITGKQTFTPYDRAVHNAVCTLYEAGNDVFNAEMVYRAMNGLTNSEYISPESIQKVTDSIDKSRSTKLIIDISDEAKARKWDDAKSATMDDMLLSALKVTLNVSGEEKDGYRFNSQPILYRYAQKTKQIISVPIQLLETKSVVKNSDTIIIFREYLIRRIEGMKKDNKLKSNRILFDTIFEDCCIDTINRNQLKRYRDYITAILDLWKNETYITNYNLVKDGVIIKGIDIGL